MATQWIQIATVLIILTIGGPAFASSSQTSADTYTWNAEFVSLDTTAMTLTVKSPVAYREAIAELTQFKPGERVWIVWSGVHDSSDAVRQVRKSQPQRKIDENLVLPADLVTTDAPNSYITIRVRIPASVSAAIRAVKPGEWITVTSRHRPASDADAVVAVRPWSQAGAAIRLLSASRT